jgi:hypothetical protein
LTDFYRAVAIRYTVVTELFYPEDVVVDSLLAQFWAVPRNVLNKVYWPATQHSNFFSGLFSKNIFKDQKQHLPWSSFTHFLKLKESTKSYMSSFRNQNGRFSFYLLDLSLRVLNEPNKENSIPAFNWKSW